MQGLIPLVIVLAILAVPLVWLIGVYNALVRLRQHVPESWSNVDTELKRRYDLIPRLVATVKGYAKHEQQVLEKVIRARQRAAANEGSTDSQAHDETELVRSLRQLLAVSERYPDLKASEHFMQLQEELVNTEDRIQAARRFFNGNVREYNNRVLMFPSNIVAQMMGFKPESFFEIEALERAAPPV